MTFGIIGISGMRMGWSTQTNKKKPLYLRGKKGLFNNLYSNNHTSSAEVSSFANCW